MKLKPDLKQYLQNYYSTAMEGIGDIDQIPSFGKVNKGREKEQVKVPSLLKSI